MLICQSRGVTFFGFIESLRGAEERLAQLEDRVSHQETIIKALQARSSHSLL
jgi:hypothetical protein